MLARPLVGEHVRPFGSHSEAACSVLSEVPRQIRGEQRAQSAYRAHFKLMALKSREARKSEGGQVSAFDAALLIAAGE